MCFKWYHVTKIKAVESAFDHPNFDLVLLAIHFELWPVNRVHKLTENGGRVDVREMAALNGF
jgi:hypothetical protein